GVPAVFAPQRPEAEKVLEGRAREVNAPFTSVAGWQISDICLDARGSRFTLAGESTLQIRCPLAGAHQVDNAATAAIALLRLGVSEPAIEEGIARTRWPGRLELVSQTPEIIIDGAHKPAGARALAAYI